MGTHFFIYISLSSSFFIFSTLSSPFVTFLNTYFSYLLWMFWSPPFLNVSFFTFFARAGLWKILGYDKGKQTSWTIGKRGRFLIKKKIVEFILSFHIMKIFYFYYCTMHSLQRRYKYNELKKIAIFIIFLIHWLAMELGIIILLFL